MSINKNALDTYRLLKATAEVAEKSLEGRIQHYRAHLKSEEKELRTYTQKAFEETQSRKVPFLSIA